MIKVRQNLRKVATIAICLAGSATMFAQSNTTDDGVKIYDWNNFVWAIRNVGEPGTFVANIQDYGNLYSWEEAQTACPSGWRLPTPSEFSLPGSSWTNVGGINGRRYISTVGSTAGNNIFLPAAGYGYLRGTEIEKYYVGERGYYATTNWGNGYSSHWEFQEDNYWSGRIVNSSGSNDMMPIRCVKDENVGINDISTDTENATVTGFFDILGRKLNEEPKEGFYIIRYSNGTSKKMIK